MESIPFDFKNFDLTGNYRAIVEDNEDPLEVGRVRIRILGIHSLSSIETPVDHLPWAEPCLALYNSGGKNLKNSLNKNTGRYTPDGNQFSVEKRDTERYVEEFQDTNLLNSGSGGIFTVPKKGTLVWVFFDNGLHTRPQYWAIASKAEDWKEQKNKLNDEIKKKIEEIASLRDSFTPDNKEYLGESCSSDGKVKTNINKPKLKVNQTDSINNKDITSFSSPGGVTYIIVNENGKEKTYIIHKGNLEYTDENGQKKILVGYTNGKANDLEQAIANNYELHIGGDFDIFVNKGVNIQVNGDAQVNVKGNAGIHTSKDLDLLSDGNINIEAKKNINIHAKQNFQVHVEKNSLQKFDGNIDININGTYNMNCKMSAKIKTLDLHIKSTTNQIFESALQQTFINTSSITKSKTMCAISSDAILRFNSQAAIQQTAPAIDLGGTAVNIGGAVMFGNASSQPAPVVQPPSTDAQTLVNQKQFIKSNQSKQNNENPPAI